MEPILGEIRMFAGNFAPTSPGTWHICDGSLLPISANTALFSLLGTTYGGDGKTTFGLPDLRGRCAIGTGPGPGLTTRVLGEKGGTESVTLIATQIPAHIHPLTGGTGTVTGGKATSAVGGLTSPIGNISSAVQDAGGTDIASYAAPSAANGNMGDGGTVTLSGNTAPNAGGGLPHSNMQPYQAVTFMIATTGIYPTRP
jgi:microcystin-dependent protein